METVVITGGSGLIGNHLAKLLVEEDYKVILLSRTPDKTKGVLIFDLQDGTQPQVKLKKAIEEADYIIHLAGENIGAKDGRLPERRK